MDQANALEALSNVLDNLSQNPYDISLHAKHIAVAAKTGAKDHVQSARQMMTGYLAAGEDVWIPLLEEKQNSADLNTLAGVSETLALYNRAEEDYLCA